MALVTPFNEDKSVDYEGLKAVINSVIDGGVQYVVVLGTTGETPTLTMDERKEIVSQTYETVGGRVPVVVGIGGNDTRAVIKEIETLPLEGAVAILSSSPSYSKPSQEGIYQHYKAIASSTAKPIILYNVPGRTGSNIAASTTLRLATELSNINGIKEASGNMAQCQELLRDKPLEFMVTSGDDGLALAQIACGMDGLISVAANALPKEVAALVSAALENDYKTARAMNYKLLEAFELLFAENNPAGVKAFLSELGLIKNQLRLPLVPLSSGINSRVREYLATIK